MAHWLAEADAPLADWLEHVIKFSYTGSIAKDYEYLRYRRYIPTVPLRTRIALLCMLFDF